MTQDNKTISTAMSRTIIPTSDASQLHRQKNKTTTNNNNKEQTTTNNNNKEQTKTNNNNNKQ